MCAPTPKTACAWILKCDRTPAACRRADPSARRPQTRPAACRPPAGKRRHPAAPVPGPKTGGPAPRRRPRCKAPCKPKVFHRTAAAGWKTFLFARVDRPLFAGYNEYWRGMRPAARAAAAGPPGAGRTPSQTLIIREVNAEQWTPIIVDEAAQCAETEKTLRSPGTPRRGKRHSLPRGCGAGCVWWPRGCLIHVRAAPAAAGVRPMGRQGRRQSRSVRFFFFDDLRPPGRRVCPPCIPKRKRRKDA